jgi:hypothetical protein
VGPGPGLAGIVLMRGLVRDDAARELLFSGRVFNGQLGLCTSLIVLQLVEQSLGLLEIERVEAFGKPAVGRSEKLASLIPLALIKPEPRHAHCGRAVPRTWLVVGAQLCARLFSEWPDRFFLSLWDSLPRSPATAGGAIVSKSRAPLTLMQKYIKPF